MKEQPRKRQISADHKKVIITFIIGILCGIGFSILVFVNLFTLGYYKLSYGTKPNRAPETVLLSRNRSLFLDNPYLKRIYVVDDSRYVSSVAFSSDGKLLVAGGFNRVNVWNLETNELLCDYETESGWQTVTPIPGKLAMVYGGNQDERLDKYDITTCHSRNITRRAGRIKAITFTPNGQNLISASDDNTIKIWAISTENWNTSTDKLLRTIISPADSLVVTPDGKNILSSSKQDVVKVWNLESGKLERSLSKQTRSAVISISPDGQTFVTCDSWKAYVWDLKSGQLVRTLSESGPIRMTAFSQDGSKLIGGDDSLGVIYVWDNKTGKRLHKLQAKKPSSIATSSTGLVATGQKNYIPYPLNVNVLVHQIPPK
jgi:WD40 repeat protein